MLSRLLRARLAFLPVLVIVDDQERFMDGLKDVLSNASQKPSTETAATMTTHHNEVAVF